MIKYVGIFRVFPAILDNGEITSNPYDNYLLGRYKIQVYRWDKDTLCIYFQSNQTVNNIIPKLKELGVELELYLQGETEQIFKVHEKYIEKLHDVIHFQTKGKNIQAKSVRNKRRLQKDLENKNKKKKSENS